MITLEYEDKYHCDTVHSEFIKYGEITMPVAVIHHMPNNIEFFYIPFLEDHDENDGIYGYYISMYEPKYVIETKNKLTKDMKESLMRILNILSSNYLAGGYFYNIILDSKLMEIENFIS